MVEIRLGNSTIILKCKQKQFIIKILFPTHLKLLIIRSRELFLNGKNSSSPWILNVGTSEEYSLCSCKSKKLQSQYTPSTIFKTIYFFSSILLKNHNDLYVYHLSSLPVFFLPYQVGRALQPYRQIYADQYSHVHNQCLLLLQISCIANEIG